MRQIKELIRLKHEHGLSVRQIARSCGLPVSTVGDYLKRAQAVGLSWPLPEELTEEQLLDKLLGSAGWAAANPPARALPDWKATHQELRRKGASRCSCRHSLIVAGGGGVKGGRSRRVEGRGPSG
jgi:hypothetical protein